MRARNVRVPAISGRSSAAVTEAEEGKPPELPPDHTFVRICEARTGKPAGTAPFGTDASILQSLAPCVVCGPADIGVAHRPGEAVRLQDLTEAVPVFQAIARDMLAS
jgi:acetylornithine deacetylase/succinyl-diaminopimelate desuccinylase-like protein